MQALRNQLLDVVQFFKNCLVYFLMGLLGSLFLNQTIECHHRQQVLLIVYAELLAVIFKFFVNELSGRPHTLLIESLYLHRVFAVGYFYFYGKILHQRIDHYLSTEVGDTLVNLFDVFVHLLLQLRNTSVFRVYLIYNFSDFDLIFKIG